MARELPPGRSGTAAQVTKQRRARGRSSSPYASMRQRETHADCLAIAMLSDGVPAVSRVAGAGDAQSRGPRCLTGVRSTGVLNRRGAGRPRGRPPRCTRPELAVAGDARLSGNARRGPPWQDPHGGLGPPGPYLRSQRGPALQSPSRCRGQVRQFGHRPRARARRFHAGRDVGGVRQRTRRCVWVDAHVRWKLTRWPGRRRGITRQRRRPMRRSLRLARTNLVRRGMRSQTWTLRSLRRPRLRAVIR